MPGNARAPTLEQLLIEALQGHLARARGEGYRIIHVQFRVVGPDGIESEQSFHPAGHFHFQEQTPIEPAPSCPPDTAPVSAEIGQDARPDSRPDRPHLTRSMQQIVDVLEAAAGPLQGYAIARRAGRSYNPYFRGLLSGMQQGDEPILTRIGDGYWLTSRPPPALSGDT